MLFEMMRQHDLLAPGLCIPIQTKHTTPYSKQSHHTQRQYIYLKGPASSSDLANTVFNYVHTEDAQHCQVADR